MKGYGGKLVAIGLVLIGLSLAGNLILYVFGLSPFAVTDIGETRTISAAGITRIHIFSNDGHVRVVPGGDEITVHMSGKTERGRKGEFRLSVSGQDGRVAVLASREFKRRLLSVYPGGYELVVKLPDRLYEQVEIVAEYADVSAEGIRAGLVKMKTTYGNIAAGGLSGEIAAETVTGDIRLVMRSIVDDIRAATTHGKHFGRCGKIAGGAGAGIGHEGWRSENRTARNKDKTGRRQDAGGKTQRGNRQRRNRGGVFRPIAKIFLRPVVRKLTAGFRSVPINCR